jgi:hypothetical protein
MNVYEMSPKTHNMLLSYILLFDICESHLSTMRCILLQYLRYLIEMCLRCNLSDTSKHTSLATKVMLTTEIGTHGRIHWYYPLTTICSCYACKTKGLGCIHYAPPCLHPMSYGSLVMHADVNINLN